VRGKVARQVLPHRRQSDDPDLVLSHRHTLARARGGGR
jgi:hypothetical protein